MAVAHKGSISMGLVLIPIGMYKTLRTMTSISISLIKKVRPGLNIRNTAPIAERK